MRLHPNDKCRTVFSFPFWIIHQVKVWSTFYNCEFLSQKHEYILILWVWVIFFVKIILIISAFLFIFYFILFRHNVSYFTTGLMCFNFSIDV